MKKGISILGSTGFIGRNTLEIVRGFPERFHIVALSAWANIDLLEKQILEFKPNVVSVSDRDLALQLEKRLSGNIPKVFYGLEGLIEVATIDEADTIVSAIVGSAGLIPTLSAIKAGKDVALANKESLVMAGQIIMDEVKKKGINLFPVDSEHSAIFQTLQGHRKEDVKRLVLTASGGPFWKYTCEAMDNVTPNDALNHPNWKMGKKITIDSATLMNKGLEVIEARWLFDIPVEQIAVYIHPQSIVHSMVEYIDESILAQMASPDMRGPIAYALSYPERLKLNTSPVDLCSIQGLTFFEPDTDRFPSLKLAYEAIRIGKTMPVVLSSADEIAVNAFLNMKIPFHDISKVIEDTMSSHKLSEGSSVEEIMKIDKWARNKAKEIIEKRRIGNSLPRKHTDKHGKLKITKR